MENQQVLSSSNVSPSEQPVARRRGISYTMFALAVLAAFGGLFGGTGPLLVILGLAIMAVGLVFYRRGK